MIINENNEITEYEQRAILVGIDIGKSEISIERSMAELKELSKAAGAEVLETVVQKKSSIDSKYFIGKGKVEEIKMMATALDANTIIFNDELSPSQIRNLEEKLEIAIIDRTTLILDIFAQRAITREAKLQVEMAQLRYRLPRLVGLGRSLSRTGGGIGTRGPGEQKLELDRRRILDRISDIKKSVKEVKKNREVQRAQRNRNNIPVVALVGYTNAGKSTLMNRLINMSKNDSDHKQVYSEDMLFATLDTFHRKIILEDNKEFVLIDTVGFVSKLPHHLIEAFKATLEEVVEADLLIHVVDISNDNYDMQIKVTNEVLKNLGANNKSTIYCLNKFDKTDEGFIAFDEEHIYISALNGYGIDKLIDKITTKIFKGFRKVNMLIPYNKGEIYSHLCDKCNVINMEYKDDGTFLQVELDEILYNKYNQYIINE